MKIGLLLCVAILGVAQGNLESAHTSVKLSSNKGFFKGVASGAGARVAIFETTTNANYDSTCGSNNFYDEGRWWVLSNSAVQGSVMSQWDIIQSGVNFSFTSPLFFNGLGKFKACYCETNCCDTVDSQNSTACPFNEDIGHLHVVDTSTEVMVTKTMFPALDVGAPTLFAALNEPFSTSWIFNSIDTNTYFYDRFMVIDSEDPFDCGKAGINSLGNKNVATPTANTSYCETDISDLSAPSQCHNKFVREGDDLFAATPKESAIICFCRFTDTQSCSSQSDYQISLGPIRFLENYEPSTMHYTTFATTAQKITMSSGGSDDAFAGLVRLDDASAYEAWQYSEDTRACGWSNLDPLPAISDASSNSRVYAKKMTSIGGQYSLDLDFTYSYERKYALCLCRDAALDSGGNNSPLSQFCSDNTLFDTTNSISNNGGGNFLNTRYGLSFGFIHVVTAFPTNLLLEAGKTQYISVNFMSRKSSVTPVPEKPVDDAQHYHSRVTDFVNSRLMFVSGDSCSDITSDKIPSEISTISRRNNMYVYIQDTGSAQEDTSAFGMFSYATRQDTTLDLLASGTTMDVADPPAAWGALWSLTTGWDRDDKKPHGGTIPSAASASAASASVEHSVLRGLATLAESSAVGGTYSLCFCDQLAEFWAGNSGTCRSSFLTSDYSKFSAKLGEVKVADFVIGEHEQSDPKHYVIDNAEGTSHKVTLTHGGANVHTGDRVGAIPAYGDGYGVDTASPGYSVINGTTISALSSPEGYYADPIAGTEALFNYNRPWKTSYYCGKANFGTTHYFYSDGSWRAVPGILPIKVSGITSTTVDVDFIFSQSYDLRKYKLCYCSVNAWGSECPHDPNDFLDVASSAAGFMHVYRYSDFAGYLHIVDVVTTLPVYHTSPTGTTGNAFDIVWGSPSYVDATADAFTYLSSTNPLCGIGTEIIGLSNTLALSSGTPTTSEVTISFNRPEFSTNSSRVLPVCYCSYYGESLEEVVPTDRISAPPSSCDSANNPKSFGITIGTLAVEHYIIAPTKFQHVTVHSGIDSQAISLTPESEAKVTFTGDVVDHVGFIPMSQSCGVDTFGVSRVAAITSMTNGDLHSEAFNFRAALLQKRTLYRICYCQIAIYDDTEYTECDPSVPEMWYQAGFLHIVDIPAVTYPQSFVLPADRRDGGEWMNALPQILVEFESSTSWDDGSRFVITGFEFNSEYTQQATFTCGGGNDDGTSSDLTYSKTLNAPVRMTNAATWAKVDSFQDLTSSISYGREPGAASVLGEWLGADNWKYLCMCDPTEPDPTDGIVKPNRCAGSNSIADFGITVGKLWMAKTVTLPATVDADNNVTRASMRYSIAVQHWTVQKNDATFFDISQTDNYPSTSCTPGDTSCYVAPISDDDYVAFAVTTQGDDSRACGYTDELFVETSVSVTGRVNVDATGFSGIDKQSWGQSLPSYKYQVCYCRAALIGHCSTVNYWAFFSLSGYLHIVDIVSTSFPITYSVHKGEPVLTVEFVFKSIDETPSQYDRFAVMPMAPPESGSPQLSCGQYFRSKLDRFGMDGSQFGSTLPDHDEFEIAAYYNYDVNRYDIPSSAEPSYGVNQLTLILPNVTFLTNYAYKVCMCSYASEHDCPSLSQAENNLPGNVEYYSYYGADIGVIFAASYLTGGFEDQQFTAFYSELPSAQITIVKTPDSSTLSFDNTTDKFAVIGVDEVCGDIQSTLYANGGLEGSSTTADPLYSNLDSCQTNVTGDECSTFRTEASALHGLTPGLYKVCLCSAVGTADNSTLGCRDNFISDYKDTAGRLHIMDGLPNQMFSFNDVDVFTMSIDLDGLVSDLSKVALVSEDRFCGDTGVSDTLVEGLNISLTTAADNDLLTVTGTTPSVGAYKICYCDVNHTSAGCGDYTASPTDYGATIGLVFFTDFEFYATNSDIHTATATSGEPLILDMYASTPLTSVAPVISLTATVFFSPDGCVTNATEPVSALSQYNFTFNDPPSRTKYILCIDTGDNAYPTRAIDDVSIYVGSVTITPDINFAVDPTENTITYLTSLKVTDHVWLRRTSVTCEHYNADSDADSSGALPVSLTGSSYQFEFTNVTDDDSDSYFRICGGSGCSGSTCAEYFDFRAVSTSEVRVFNQFSLDVNAVKNTASSPITITHSDFLHGAQVWFRKARDNNLTPLNCTHVDDDSSSAILNGVPSTGSVQDLTFNFSNVADSLITQQLYRVCANLSDLTTVDISFIGVHVVDVIVSPQWVPPTVSSITIDIEQTIALQNGDKVWFQATSEVCDPSAPPAASTSTTNSVVFNSNVQNYEFDFTQLDTIVRMCVETNYFYGVLDYDTDSTRISVVNIILSENSVPNADDIELSISYDSLTTGTDHYFWFQDESEADCVNIVNISTASYSLSNSRHSSFALIPESGGSVSFNFANLASSQERKYICVQYGSASTPVKYPEVGVIVTSIELQIPSVFIGNNQFVVLAFDQASDDLQVNNTFWFLDSSIPCGEVALSSKGTPKTEVLPDNQTGYLSLETHFNYLIDTSNNLCPYHNQTFAPTPSTCTNICPSNTNCVVSRVDFGLIEATTNRFRLCVESTGKIIDYNSVEISVVDIDVTPKAFTASLVSSDNVINVTFTGKSGTGVPPSTTLAPGDLVYFASGDDCASSTKSTAAVVVTNVFSYSFTFTSGIGEYFLCIDHDGIVTNAQSSPSYFSGVTIDDFKLMELHNTIRITDIFSNSASVDATTDSASVDITNLGSETGFAMYVRMDVDCPYESFSESAVQTGRVALANSMSFNFSVAAVSEIPFRLCVYVDVDNNQFTLPYDDVLQEIISYDNIQLIVSDLQLVTSSVYTTEHQVVELSATVGLDIGDGIFFQRLSSGDTCGVIDSGTGLKVAPTSPGAEFSATDYVKTLSTQYITVEFDMSGALTTNEGAPWTLCLVSSTGVISTHPPSSHGGLYVLNEFSTYLSSKVIRQAELDRNITFFYNTLFDISNFANEQFCFSPMDSVCSCSPLTAPVSGSSAAFTFPGDLSDKANKLCRYNDDSFVNDYSSIGVIVTDLTIAGSSEADDKTVGCVRKGTSQTVSFSMSRSIAFAYSDVLYFVSSESKACERGMSVSSSLMSGTSQMTWVPDGPSSETVTFDLDFDFKNVVLPTNERWLTFRLCVQTSNGVVDFFPLGVRVTDVTISGSTDPFAVTPVERPLLVAGTQLVRGTTETWFIDANDGDATCECTKADNCPGGTSKPMATEIATLSDSTGSMYNFSTFLAADGNLLAESLKLCVHDTDISLTYALDCVRVTFDVAVKPSTVPANSGQVVTLEYNGAILDNAVVMWTSKACSSVEYPTLADFKAEAEQTSNYDTSSWDLSSSSGIAMTFDFNSMYSFFKRELTLCAYHVDTGVVFQTSTKLTVTKSADVMLVGDPHVRTASGKWVDFYGESGVYELLSGVNLEVNAKMGYAVRENHMIWHPKVMRPGTVVQEIGLRLPVDNVHIHFGVFGGGVVSIRESGKATVFWTSAANQIATFGDFELKWEKQDSSLAMPWGTHERGFILSLKGHDEHVDMFVSESGGYSFIDVEIKEAGSCTSGLLADASSTPLALENRLMSGKEAHYKVSELTISA